MNFFSQVHTLLATVANDALGTLETASNPALLQQEDITQRHAQRTNAVELHADLIKHEAQAQQLAEEIALWQSRLALATAQRPDLVSATRAHLTTLTRRAEGVRAHIEELNFVICPPALRAMQVRLSAALPTAPPPLSEKELQTQIEASVVDLQLEALKLLYAQSAAPRLADPREVKASFTLGSRASR